MILEKVGKGGITARLIAYSASYEDRIATFELEYPRFIHGEFMTHRLFSRNAMSSRAVPVKKMIQLVEDNPAMPIFWGANKAGMQATEECTNLIPNPFLPWQEGVDPDYDDGFDDHLAPYTVQEYWQYLAEEAAIHATALDNAGYHKQIVNRILEPFQMMKTVMTTTEIDNFLYLRDHEDAQPEIKELAGLMYELLEEATCEFLGEDEWHVPYITTMLVDNVRKYFVEVEGDLVELTLDEALKVSSSCCAQISYRLLDDSLEKALTIYGRLVESKPVHASPFEHQAKPISLQNVWDLPAHWEEGITHFDRDGNLWSGNFKGFIQHRQLIPDHVFKGVYSR